MLVALARPAALLAVTRAPPGVVAADLGRVFSASYRNPGTFRIAALGPAVGVAACDGVRLVTVDLAKGCGASSVSFTPEIPACP